VDGYYVGELNIVKDAIRKDCLFLSVSCPLYRAGCIVIIHDWHDC
jgi:hypothetical protein